MKKTIKKVAPLLGAGDKRKTFAVSDDALASTARKLAVKKSKTAISIGSSIADKSYPEILAMEEEIGRVKKLLKVDHIGKVRQKVLDMIEEEGLKPGDVFPKLGNMRASPGTSTKSLPSKHAGRLYVNPNNTEQRWPGRGPMPKWLRKIEASGTKIEDLLV
jgi:DNA-binding protein H-NS